MDFDDISEKMLYLVVTLYFPFVLFYLIVNTPQNVFQSFTDLPDTAASIKVFSEYGFFGKVPYFLNGEYYLFGSIPPLTPVLGAFINFFVNDYILAATLLSFLGNIIIFYILNFKIFKNQPLFYKIALSIFLLADSFIGTCFPFSLRIRQTWAIVFGLLAYVNNDNRLLFLFSFLSFIAQPVVGAVFFFLFSLRLFLEEQDVKKILIIILSFFLSLVFVWKLILLSSLQPMYVGCSFSSTTSIYFYPVLILLFLPFYCIVKKAKPYEKLALLLFSFPALLFILYAASSSLWYSFISAIPFGFDMNCGLFASSLFFFIISFFSREILPDQYKKFFAFSAYLVLMTSLNEYNLTDYYPDYGPPIFSEGKSATGYSYAIIDGPPFIIPHEPLFSYSSISFIKNMNMSFPESPISTGLSKGEYF
ncbi:MAG: hypothetical protein QXL47_01530, partial [Candidatus Anstonellales archaeon]